MDNLDKLTIPDEYIAHYFDQLKSDLSTQNIQLSKVGFAGFMFNLLGNTQFDIKSYYEHLFKEAFPITAMDDKNLGYHSDTFGYVPALGQYSKLRGDLELNLDSLPILLGNIAKREVHFKNVELDIEGIIFTLASKYVAVLKKSGNNVTGHVEILTAEGKQKLIPFQLADPTFPIYDFNQYQLDTTTFTSPDYIFGTSYSYSIDIGEDDYVTQIEVEVEGEKYDTSRNKSFAGPDEQVVFYEITPDNRLLIELGSGINGKYIPGAIINIIVYKTKGSLGNIGSQQLKVTSGDIQIFDYADDNTLITQLINPTGISNVLSADIESGYNGKDPLKGKALRDELIKYIQSRNNLTSETDYRQILDNYFDDYEVIFKKMKMCENVFYVYQFFKDRYQNPVKTITKNVLETDFVSSMVGNSIYYPEFELEGETFLSPFLYIYDSLFNVYNGHIVKKAPTFYSTGITIVDPNDLDIPPLVFIQLECNVNTTTIVIKSYQDISENKFTLNIPTLNMADIILSPSIEENTLEYVYDGIFIDIVDITIDVYDIYDIHKFGILFEEVQQVVDISGLLKLKTYTKTDGNKYVVNTSLIHKDTYLGDEEYYIDKIINVLGEVDIDSNRMISDEIQVRLLNTYNVDANYLRKITSQHHNISDIEVTHVTLRADSGGDLGGTYFELNSINNQFYVWFDVDGNSNDPRPDLDNDFSAKKEEIKCTISSNSTIGEVRFAVQDTLNNYQLGSIFKATSEDMIDGVLSVWTVEGGTVKNIRDPDPTSNNPNLPTGFTYAIVGVGKDIGLKFPLKLKVELAVDKQTIISNNIPLSTELEEVRTELAMFLYEEKTKIYLKFYSSEIVDILHNRIWIKSAKAYITDVDGKMVEDSNIEILPYYTIEEDLQKEELLDYTPMLWWFDLNNIDIVYTI
jgi:hypothetical protein